MPSNNPGVDAIIRRSSEGQRAILVALREIIHAGDPEIVETVKWKKPSNPLGVPVFEHHGIVCILIPLKARVRISFAEGASLPDPKNLYNAQPNGMSRAIDFPEGAKIDVAGVKALVRAGVALRTLKRPPAAKAPKPVAKTNPRR